ncbi:hypothetical protein DL771_007614 [Monosporascus sp. 5C6A]|nr:hypothetical protein DL771_007614 [Monosporascus sp. 5C6A]
MSGWGDFSSMKATLPEGGITEPGTTKPTPATEARPKRTEPIEPWVEKTAYEYEEVGDRNWDGNARVYEWDGEEGDIGPEHPELENILFGKPEERNPQGINFAQITEINVTQEGLKRIQPIQTFETAGLHPAMLRNVQLCGYRIPTPIQKYCVPAIKMGYDLIAIAQTGSGKTAAYLIPILNHLMGKAKKLAAPRPSPQAYESGIASPVRAEPLVVIVCPARELAVQIFNEARKFCYRTMLRPCTVYGGGPLREQVLQLQRGCDVLVATPGRLIDMMNRPDVLSFRRVKYMVIDEADEMLESDWEEEFKQILSGGEQEEGNVKYMLFSATFPVAVRQLARTHMAENHIRLRVGRVGSTHDNIRQDVIFVDPYAKKQALLDLLCSMKPARTIIFVNSKRMADEIDDFLFHNELPSTSMHSDRTQREREDSMRAFRSGKAPILVTTGVTARGIDVRNVMHVINFDLPNMDHGGIQEYVHRIGRTGRIGHKGIATSFYTERDEAIAPLLTLTLMETKQEIPDFLQQYIPPDADPNNLKFEDDTDEELEKQKNGGGGGNGTWGAPATGGNDTGDAWGAPAAGGDNAGDAWGAPAVRDSGPAAKQEDDTWGGNAASSGNANGDAWGSGPAAKRDDDSWGNNASAGGNANGDTWGSSAAAGGNASNW